MKEMWELSAASRSRGAAALALAFKLRLFEALVVFFGDRRSLGSASSRKGRG